MNVIEQIPFLRDLPVDQQALIVIIATPFLVWFLALFIRTVILRFVMAPVRVYANKTETEIDNKVLNIIERPLRILMIGIAIAIISNMLKFTGDLESIANSLANGLILASIFFFLYNLVDIVSVTSDNLRSLTGLRIADRLLPFLRVVVKTFIVIMGALIIVQEFGYSIAGLIASFGVIGLAISLAAQDTAANVIGFTAIVSDNPFQVGDYIVTADVTGTVEEVGVRTTRVRKLDQSLVTVPNSNLTKGAVTNWSRLSKRRLDFYIGLTYRTTADQMHEVVTNISEMLKSRSVVDEESVIVRFMEFGDSALRIRVIAYVFLSDWGEFTAEQADVNYEIMKIVESAGTSMAFPSTSVYLEPMEDEQNSSRRSYRIPQPHAEYKSQEDDGTAEARYQDNESVSSDDDGGDAK